MSESPPLYVPLRTPEEMRLWDTHAEKILGISQVMLMENAAREAVALLRDRMTLKPQTRILVLMGRGNNGGDGASLARHLHEAGCRVLTLHSGPLENLQGAAAEHVRMALATGTPFFPVPENHSLDAGPEWAEPDIVVDALLGTGIAGNLREKECALVRAVNAHKGHAFIYSLDIPSGLCGYTGLPRPEAVRANLTISFEAGKPGLFFPEAEICTGEVKVMTIGMPARILTALFPPTWRLLSPQPGLWASPDPLRHKGEAGKVLVIGGSAGMAGAPILAARGALRAGAGLVHVAVPGGVSQTISGADLPEMLLHSVGNEETWQESDAPAVAELVRRIQPDTLLMGPGMGRTAGVRTVLKAMLEVKNRCPVILDADSLFFFRLPPVREKTEKKHNLTLPLTLLSAQDILTPHPGEMARLLPCSFYEGHAGADPEINLSACVLSVQEDRPAVMRAFTRACPAVLVLKGPGTLVGQHGSPVTLAPFAAATLGVGGSGDVLAGVIAALRAARFRPGSPFARQASLSSLDAACLGVYLHGRSGEILAKDAPLGHFARDIADAVPLAWKELCF